MCDVQKTCHYSVLCSTCKSEFLKTMMCFIEVAII